MTTFTFPPSNAQLTEKPRVVVAKFGDGYAQRTAFGLNINPQSWSLTFSNKRAADRDAIMDFLRAAAGVSAFDWQPPGEVVSFRFTCADYAAQINIDKLWTITATFEQDFGN
jgi:phage-related protein